MPYEKIRDHPDCPADRPIAVVKQGTDKSLGCHPDEAAANRQIAALMAQEQEAGAEEALAAVIEGPRWSAPDGIVLEGEQTGDGRMIERGALEWPAPPIVVPLRWQPTDLPGHEGAVLVGRIDTLMRADDRIVAGGVFDTGPNAQEAARLVREGFLRGVSVDIDMGDGEIVEQADGRMVETVRRGRIRAATLVDIPAFAGAGIELADEDAPVLVGQRGPAIDASAMIDASRSLLFAAGQLAAAGKGGPPPGYFDDPQLTRRAGFHVEPADAQGYQRVWGHLYGWGECHLGSPPGRCVTIPHGSTARALFASQDGRGVRCSSGELINTGPIVLAADHAPTRGEGARWMRAKSHYDNTGLAVADVAVGEDEYGIWVAGVIRPGAASEMIHAVQASGISGDWRPVGGRLELVAVISCNTPGYPALVASIEGGELVAVIASARMAPETGCSCGGASSPLDAALSTLAAQGREIETLRALTASARAETIADLEARMDIPAKARALETSLLG